MVNKEQTTDVLAPPSVMSKVPRFALSETKITVKVNAHYHPHLEDVCSSREIGTIPYALR